jgi:hypothetical protein
MARYDAFLIRVWYGATGAERQWAIRLQHLPDGRTARLDSPDALAAYLQAAIGATIAEESHGAPADLSFDPDAISKE